MKRLRVCLLPRAWLLVAGLFFGPFLVFGQEASTRSALFDQNRILSISLSIDTADIARLRNTPRGGIKALIVSGTNQWKSVDVHIKGATGSFQSVDKKPSLTLSFETAIPTPRFFGFRKIHLNNSVEDGSYLNELLGGELFRKAGVPAARAGHAVVSLNGKRLGIYVVKEGFTEDFLSDQFGSSANQIYEPRDGRDVNGEMEGKIDSRPTVELPCHRLTDAIRLADPDERWRAIGAALDLDKFVSFMAMEVLLGHGDGYCIRKNNFRVVEISDGRVAFVPHGMDQLFGRAPSIPYPRMNGLVAAALMETPRGREGYGDRIGFLFANVFEPSALFGEIESRASALAKELTRSERRDFQREVSALKERIRERHRLMGDRLDADKSSKGKLESH